MIFTPDVLRSSFQRKHIATLQELKQALQTTSTMTVFRKLKALGYRTSYSHRGKYYTLLHIPQFDERGLWSSGGVWFSRDGNLLATAQRFVEQSPAGVTASGCKPCCMWKSNKPCSNSISGNAWTDGTREACSYILPRRGGGNGSNVGADKASRWYRRSASPLWRESYRRN
jgi:hypothetical protein